MKKRKTLNLKDIGASLRKAYNSFVCFNIMERNLEKAFKAIKVFGNTEKYKIDVPNPYSEFCFVYSGITDRDFNGRCAFLKDFGLVGATARHGMQGKISDENKILVYEDPRVVRFNEDGNQYAGSWRVHCMFNSAPLYELQFLFKYWNEGLPSATREDTMIDIATRFNEQFPGAQIYQHGRNYKVDIDFRSLIRDSPFAVKVGRNKTF